MKTSIAVVIQRGAERFKLSPRETQVMTLIASGHTLKSAAAECGISVHTLRHHVERSKGKLAAQSLIQAVCILTG